MLLSGPTGSGKTTTLYAALRQLREPGTHHILTIENPVEIPLDGVNQIQIDGERVTFAKALRSVLRHDPDIIMVGEIRDPETADIAVKSALTGHLVLATLHANTSVCSEDQLNRRVTLLGKLVEPAVFLLVGGFVGLVYFGFFLAVLTATRAAR